MNRTTVYLAGPLLIAPLAGPSVAQTTTGPDTVHRMGAGHGRHPQHRRHGGMERLDVDRDGRVSRAEFDAGNASHASYRPRSGNMRRRVPDFASIDRNHDGYVVASEVRAYHERMRPHWIAERQGRFERRFAQADLNHDGRLGRVEVSEKSPWLRRRFAWLDENRDGFLSRPELQAARHDHR